MQRWCPQASDSTLGFSGREVATLSVRPCSNEPLASLHYEFNLLEP